MTKKAKIFIAIDLQNLDQTKELIYKLSPKYCGIKVGNELFTVGGPKLIEWIQKKGFEIFLDLKFYDIPNTVRNACHAAANLGVSIINVHALGGIDMMKAGKEGIENSNFAPKLIGVTLLTSHDQDSLAEIGLYGSINEQILRLAKNVKISGLDGIVCSAIDIENIKKTLPNNFIYITPGIRLEHSLKDDQKRIMTPQEAIKSGSNILIIGRPITKSNNPEETLLSIYNQIQ
jgi:orotidine-5'-phosphate decarboxylase